MGFDAKVFGVRLRELRNERGMTIVDLAKVLQVRHSAVSRWENGLRKPCADSIYNISKFFNVSAGYLIGLED